MEVHKLFQVRPEEEVLEVVREDGIPQAPRLALVFFWTIVPFFFLFPLFRLGILGVIMFLVLVLSALAFALKSYRVWANTVLVVTDKRVVDVDQRGLFDRVVTEVSHPHIDEVSYRIRGPFAMMFRYGTLRVTTSGNGADIEFRRLRAPARIHDLINDLREGEGPGQKEEGAAVERERPKKRKKKNKPHRERREKQESQAERALDEMYAGSDERHFETPKRVRIIPDEVE